MRSEQAQVSGYDEWWCQDPMGASIELDIAPQRRAASSPRYFVRAATSVMAADFGEMLKTD